MIRLINPPPPPAYPTLNLSKFSGILFADGSMQASAGSVILLASIDGGMFGLLNSAYIMDCGIF